MHFDFDYGFDLAPPVKHHQVLLSHFLALEHVDFPFGPILPPHWIAQLVFFAQKSFNKKSMS